MKLLAKIYYTGSIVFFALVVIGALAQAIRGLFIGTPAFINVLFCSLAYIAYDFLLLNAIRDYKAFKANNK